MDQHLAAWQVAEFILGGLDEDELEAVYRHFDECGAPTIFFKIYLKNRGGGVFP